VRQQRRVRALRFTRGGQLDEKQTSLEETASLVEKMFVEFSTLQGGCSCPACPAPAHPALPPPPCAVEFLALKAKTSVVPGDAHDVSALHAALDSKDK
jgi:hypothetical protein